MVSGYFLWQKTQQPSTIAIVMLVLCCILSATPSRSTGPMLPGVYREQADVTGWLMSEKLDGVRGYWDGKQLLSKNGNVFHPPAEFTGGLPPFPVEGEIWGGRGSFEQTVAVVKRLQPHNGWLQLKLAIFDVPEAPGGFTQRIAKAKEWFAAHPSAYAFVIPQTRVGDAADLQEQLAQIEQLGGEGLIVRLPDGLYNAGRSTEILKIKNYEDAEAMVVAHLPGKGRNEGRMGALLVALDDGRQFKIGSGFTDVERTSPPPIGSVVTFKFYGRYQSGLPKFPSFLRIRLDQNL
jgi:DNA ligase 1